MLKLICNCISANNEIQFLLPTDKSIDIKKYLNQLSSPCYNNFLGSPFLNVVFSRLTFEVVMTFFSFPKTGFLGHDFFTIWSLKNITLY